MFRKQWSWLWEKTKRESSDPYYDLIDDFGLIVSSFQSQYGIRLSRELPTGMKWDEFRDLLVGIGPDTALGRIVSIRAEEDEDILKNFTQEQHRIRNEWKRKRARILEKMTDRTAMEADLAGIKAAFMRMAGMGGE
ncbi:bacteriophage Gp15 family protein [Muricoprocola aceti]|uniref:Bacteriophage Gp15 family protein n=1 Tax=Muricoprocola aceti TaxID=2981772 RepID=A0ABT2SMP4_9FIRM|nr:bacteriophage Gp15 family protein [Muricoprocola aceti]MCU6725777.1 bacteriophage Gp15 family protein [Muricoprocola aceti]